MDFKNLKYKFFLIFLFQIYYILLKINKNYNNSTSSKIKHNNKKGQNMFRNKTKQKIYYIESSLIHLNNKKNLIIGAIIRYNWNKIEPFFNSFKNAGFKNYDFIIFYDKMRQFTINKIKSYGVIMYKIPKKYEKKKIIITAGKSMKIS